jgi:hypothetical protein
MRGAILWFCCLVWVLVLVAGVYMTRRALAWNDLVDSAKPTGFHQIDHEWYCHRGNADCPLVPIVTESDCEAWCHHDFVYVSDDVSWGEARADLEARYVGKGWRLQDFQAWDETSGRPEHGFLVIKGDWEDCRQYENLDYDPPDYVSEETLSRARQHKTAILITMQCI